MLPALSRLIIGDGRDQGFTFSHPRLGFHFRDHVLTRQQRANTGTRFIDWGWRTLDALRNGRLKPEQAPAYVVQHFGLHLEQGGSATPETLLTLIDEVWHKAWHALEGTYSGFLADVDRAWRAAEAANRRAVQEGGPAPYLGAEILCALCRASINSIAGRISPALLGLL